ncbi:GntR family transcriptional regulator [Streptomyces sp. NPDC058052]|uniref:GntR family transcriptional regulator n=1 Tax=unclassified Streptomyces TaxID=2593676 RepID=UPI0036D08C8F
MRGYRELAARLREQIISGELSPGEKLRRIVDLMDDYGLSRQTVREAIKELADEGLVVTMGKGGTVVRNRTRVKIPLNRYSKVLGPNGARGPWETACAEQGLDGQMHVVRVARVQADDRLAEQLGVPVGAELVHRQRRATLGPDDVVQLQLVWYPADLADQVQLAGTSKIKGGVFGALVAAGHRPAAVSERVESRMPTQDEADQLKISGKVPVVAVTRTTMNSAGRVMELLQSTAPADRIELVYDNLPLE